MDSNVVAACVSVVRSNHQIIRRKARLRRLMILCSQDYTPIYATPKIRVPLMERYLDPNQALRPDYMLSRTSLEALMDLLRREKTHGWGQEVEVLMAIYWLAHGLSYRVVSRAFDMPSSTVCDIVHRVCDAILTLLESVIRFPLPAECAEVGRGFQHLAGSPAFSRCVGAIDGCHIRIKAPLPGTASEYLNRKQFHSILLQAICDSTGKFLDVFVGYPGSVHDTTVLKNSPVFVGAVYPHPGYFIVGDGGYPCTSAPITLLTPYREPSRGPVEARFNIHHAKARVIIKKAFSMMKTRWKGIFFKALELSTTFAPKVVAVCAVLHNLAVTNGDDLDPAEGDPLPPPDPQPPELDDEEGGCILRDGLAAQVSAARQCSPCLQDHDYN
ncbi:putative nuclease HARBI1 [Fundulus heteroclitus]|uniref:putative nuclease HARBI1 n=1 Tax=Fundulus heteroclitus TaxID=8078 RepID=UPI00165AC89E|nr:putative nuclease HARBI1 [Fundulus heteroclitus]